MNRSGFTTRTPAAAAVLAAAAASGLVLAGCGNSSSATTASTSSSASGQPATAGSGSGGTTSNGASSNGASSNGASSSGGGSVTVGTALFPLAVGNTWVYQEKLSGDSGTVTNKVISVSPAAGGDKVAMKVKDDLLGVHAGSTSVFVIHSDGSISVPVTQVGSTSVSVKSGSIIWPSSAQLASGQPHHDTLVISIKEDGHASTVTAHVVVKGEGAQNGWRTRWHLSGHAHQRDHGREVLRHQRGTGHPHLGGQQRGTSEVRGEFRRGRPDRDLQRPGAEVLHQRLTAPPPGQGDWAPGREAGHCATGRQVMLSAVAVRLQTLGLPPLVIRRLVLPGQHQSVDHVRRCPAWRHTGNTSHAGPVGAGPSGPTGRRRVADSTGDFGGDAGGGCGDLEARRHDRQPPRPRRHAADRHRRVRPGHAERPGPSIRVLRRAVELGVNHIDTAAFYFSPLRSANELINTALAPYPDDLVIATKVGPGRDPSGDDMTAKIREYDRAIKKLTETEYPETQALIKVYGVGYLTALTYVLTLGKKERFRRSRDVGCYLGLRPKRSQSGDSDPQLGITKAGNGYLRQLLVECANHVIGPHGKDSTLRRWGLALAHAAAATRDGERLLLWQGSWLFCSIASGSRRRLTCRFMQRQFEIRR